VSTVPPARDHTRDDTHDYRSFVGPPDRYDLMGGSQFCLLFTLGLRRDHALLDIGCGSLRAGKLFIPYLAPGRYHGVDPEKWLIEEGIEHELGQDVIAVKEPRFAHNADFDFFVFHQAFDFVIAQSIFSHASPMQVRTCLVNAAAVMAPGALFAVNYWPGDADNPNTDWTYPANVRWTEAFMQQAIEDAGLIAETTRWPHPKFTWLLLARPDDADRLRDAAARVNAACGESAAPPSAGVLARLFRRTLGRRRQDT